MQMFRMPLVDKSGGQMDLVSDNKLINKVFFKNLQAAYKFRNLPAHTQTIKFVAMYKDRWLARNILGLVGETHCYTGGTLNDCKLLNNA